MGAEAVTATELARNLSEILKKVEFSRATIAVVRNKRVIATIVPGLQGMTAELALAGLFDMVGEAAGRDWRKDVLCSERLDVGMPDPFGG